MANSLELNIEKFFLLIIKGGVYILPFLPLIVVPGFFFPYITGKNFVFRIVIDIIGALWLSLAILNPKYRPRFTKITIALILLTGISILATLFSADPFRSFWSNFERMEGLVTYLHLFVLFLILATVFKKRDWMILFYISLSVSILVSSVGFLEKARVCNPEKFSTNTLTGNLNVPSYCSYIPDLTEGGRIFSSIGNSIYLAIYLLFHLFFIAWAFFQSKQNWLKVLLVAAFIYDFAAFMLAESRGALVGLAAGVFVVLSISFFQAKNRRLKYSLAAILLISLLVTPLLLVYNQDRLVKSGIPGISRLAGISLGASTSVSRLQIWGIAREAIKDRPILGWGFENFQIPYAIHYNPNLFGNEPWFDRTHNVILDWFVHAGILGGLAYIALFAVIFWTICRLFKSGKLSGIESAFISGAITAYIVQNIFVFDNLTSYILFFSLAAYLYYKETADEKAQAKSDWGGFEVALPAFAIVLGITVAILVNARPMILSKSLITSLDKITTAMRYPNQDFNLAMKETKEMLASGTFGQREAREQLANLANTMTTVKSELQAQDVLSFLNLAISETKDEAQGRLSPKHELILARMEKQYFALTGNSYEEALGQFKKAIELAPNYIQSRFGLVELYLTSGDKTEATKEITELEKINPKSVEFWNTALLVRIYLNDEAAGISTYNKAKELVKTPPDNLDSLGKQAFGRKLYNLAFLLLEDGYQKAKAASQPFTSLVYLAQMHAERGNFDRAIELALEAEERDPKNEQLKAEIAKFIDSINKVRGQ
ncbi:O-antigen ligase family protein [Candidatus Giovannonibacteria bacterium]|nr:O-antigen ligase family protein [Candidatus Giovannonibacteria bacterium]